MPNNKKIPHELAAPGTGKDCCACGEHLTLGSFYQKGQKGKGGISTKCRLCNCRRVPSILKAHKIVLGPPLKRRAYERRLIHGSWVDVAVEISA
jgi:hypothetical protein